MKNIIIGIVALLLSAIVIFYLQYNKEHVNTADQGHAYELKAPHLYEEYEKDEIAANQKYLDKLILVKGTVMEANRKDDGSATISLSTGDPMFGILCEIIPEQATTAVTLKPGAEVTVKGICTGKLLDVVLVRTVLVDQK